MGFPGHVLGCGAAAGSRGGAMSPAETAAVPVPPVTVAVTLAQVRGASLRSNQCPGEGNHLDPG